MGGGGLRRLQHTEGISRCLRRLRRAVDHGHDLHAWDLLEVWNVEAPRVGPRADHPHAKQRLLLRLLLPRRFPGGCGALSGCHDDEHRDQHQQQRADSAWPRARGRRRVDADSVRGPPPPHQQPVPALAGRASQQRSKCTGAASARDGCMMAMPSYNCSYEY
jgi:hypothetical protein